MLGQLWIGLICLAEDLIETLDCSLIFIQVEIGKGKIVDEFWVNLIAVYHFQNLLSLCELSESLLEVPFLIEDAALIDRICKLCLQNSGLKLVKRLFLCPK